VMGGSGLDNKTNHLRYGKHGDRNAVVIGKSRSKATDTSGFFYFCFMYFPWMLVGSIAALLDRLTVRQMTRSSSRHSVREVVNMLPEKHRCCSCIVPTRVMPPQVFKSIPSCQMPARRPVQRPNVWSQGLLHRPGERETLQLGPSDGNIFCYPDGDAKHRLCY